jgi:RNA-binding protein YlmH
LEEDKMLIAILQDKIDQSYKICIPVNTGFLDIRQKEMANNYCKKIKGLKYKFFGGYDDAERCVCIILPEYEQEYEPLAALRIIKTEDNILSHRDYMGSILGLGIKRELIGDILVHADGAEIIILKELIDFFVGNYEKVGRTSIKVEKITTEEIEIGDENFEELRQSVSSLRLDNMTSSVFSIARSKAVEFISSGFAYINGQQIIKPDKTKKDRIIVIIKKYK